MCMDIGTAQYCAAALVALASDAYVRLSLRELILFLKLDLAFAF